MPVTAPAPSRPDADLRRGNGRIAAWTVVIVTFALCLARFARLVSVGAVNVLFGDQWDFLLPLFRGEGPWTLFLQQHGPHRQGAGGWVQWLIYRTSGWDVRAETWTGFVILFGAATAAVALAVRIRGRLAWWDAALVFIVLSPLHWETLLLAPNLAHSVLPLCLALLLVHAWFAPRFAIRIVSIGVFGTLCTFTGFGFCASVAAGILALASTSRANPDRGGASGLVAVFICGVALFLIGYHWAPAIPGWHFPVAEWWNYGTFVAYMGATLVGLREKTWMAITVGGAWCLLVAGVFGISLQQVWARGATRRTIASALLTGTALTYMAFTAVGRLPANVEAAFMWRYTSLTMTGALGVILFLTPWMEAVASVIWRRVTMGAVCVFAFTIWINVGPDQRTATIAVAKRNWVSAYLETRDLARANEVSNFWVYPPLPNAPHIAERLEWLEKRKLSFFKNAPPTRPAP
ncbi:MAG: hypothetical protein ABIZ81_15275 [Opitutaceae bacterium]